MAWTAPKTWTVGEVVTAANVNQQLRDNLKALAPVGKLEWFLQVATAVETVIEGGWLELNGVDVSRSTYAALWAHLGTTVAAAWTGTTTLNGALNASQTNVTLAAWPAAWPSDGRKIIILVDSEKMLVTAGQGTTALTVTRGAEGTTAATHSSGASVSAPSQSPFGHGNGSTTFSLPAAGGRMTVPAASGGHADVAQIGITEGAAAASRRPRHKHTVDADVQAAVAGSNITLRNDTTIGSANGTAIRVGPQTSAPIDAPAHIVLGVVAVKF